MNSKAGNLRSETVETTTELSIHKNTNVIPENFNPWRRRHHHEILSYVLQSFCRVNAYPYLLNIEDTTNIIPWTVSPIIILSRKFINNINFTFGESNQLLLHQFLWNSIMHEMYLYDFIIVSSKFCCILHVYVSKLGLIKIRSTWTK